MKNKIPQFAAELPGTFWGLTAYYNPVHYKTKLDNYKLFRAASRRQGLRLICVELAFGDMPFELAEGDADQVIQIRGSDILWQKERLLNIGLEHLPDDCDKFVWLDADVLFTNDQWVHQTEDFLSKYNVVQPYSFCARLPKGVYGANVEELPIGNGDGRKLCSMGYAFTHFGQPRSPGDFGVVAGGAMAARRSVFDHCGFYDRLVLGGGDTFMADAIFTGEVNSRYSYSSTMHEDLEYWTDSIRQNVQGSVFHTAGDLLHLWHGSSRYRSYTARYDILRRHKFDPQVDVKIAPSGCLEWATNKPDLHRQVKRYFWLRNEDAGFFLKIMLEFVKAGQKVWRLVNATMPSRSRIA